MRLFILQDEAKYLVLDGDVDAVWVENMNSVMDDNRLLTLPNGERIRLQSHCRLLFEVGHNQCDLCASPYGMLSRMYPTLRCNFV